MLGVFISALTANLVQHAEDYRWVRLSNWLGGAPLALSTWSVRRLPNWFDRVTQPMNRKELEALRHCVARSVPFGDPKWTKATVKRLGLESTTRPRGKPKKLA